MPRWYAETVGHEPFLVTFKDVNPPSGMEIVNCCAPGLALPFKTISSPSDSHLTIKATENGHLCFIRIVPVQQFPLAAIMFSWKTTEEKRRVKEQERVKVVRERYNKFRILIIGRANAGKTTILQRTCNTTDEPVIYGKGGKVVSRILLEMDTDADRYINDILYNQIDNTVLDPSQRVSTLNVLLTMD
jgi:hypothetical protein